MAVTTAMAVMAAANAAGGIYSASQQSKAAKRGAQVAQSTSDQNIAEQRRQYDQTRQDQLPFQQSDLARRRMADRTYGIQSQDMMGRQSVGDMPMYQGNEGQMDYGGYVRSNPDLMDAYNQSGGQYGGIEDFGQIHYQNHGRGEGRQLPMFEAQQQPQTAAMTQQQGQPFDPLADFNASADRAILNYAPISQNVNAQYSAKGAGLDGAALKALQDRTTNYTQNAFYNFRSGLEGSPTGANNALAQAGQSMANNNAQNRNTLSNALSSSYNTRANANAGAAGSVVGSMNWFGNQSGMFGGKQAPRGGVYGPSM
jgi:hypothetical protein